MGSHSARGFDSTNSSASSVATAMTYRPPRIEPAEPPPSAAALRREVREFLDKATFEPRCDSWFSGFDPSFTKQLAERGWIGMTGPEKYGGHGRSALER